MPKHRKSESGEKETPHKSTSAGACKEQKPTKSPDVSKKTISLDITKYFSPLSDTQTEKNNESGFLMSAEKRTIIIEKAISNAVESLIPYVKENILLAVNEKIERAVGDIFDVNKRVDDISEMINKVNNRVERCEELGNTVVKLQEMNSNLYDDIAYLNNALNNLEQYTRKSSMRIIGLKETNNETCEQTVVNFCHEKLGVDLCAEDIDATHRLGKLRPGENRARPILVKLAKYNEK